MVAAVVDNFEWTKRNTNKTQLLPSFLTVDQRKKNYQILRPARDPLLTSLAWLAPTITLTPLVKLKSSATFWAIKRSKQTKIEKLLSLNKAQENLWAINGPIAV